MTTVAALNVVAGDIKLRTVVAMATLLCTAQVLPQH
jgi:hypothetical protein